MKVPLLLLATVLCRAQTAVFPGGIATDSQLGTATNNLQTTITHNILSTDTTFTVASATGIAANQIGTIDSENVFICGVSGLTVSVGRSSCPNIDGRGFDSTSAVAHSATGANCNFGSASGCFSEFIVAWHHNASIKEIEAIEAATPSTTVSDLGPGSFSQHCTAASGKWLLVTQAWTAIPAISGTLACKLWHLGGTIQPGNGVTLTLQPDIKCELNEHCFDPSAGGTVAFSSLPTWISPVWWGADPSGNSATATATAAALNAASAALGSGYAGHMLIPPGTYNLNSTWLTQNTDGAVIDGSGWATNFVWSGNTTGPVMHSSGNNLASMGKFSVTVPSTNHVATVVELSDSGVTSTANDFYDVYILCTNGSSGNFCSDAIVADGPDGNNDFHSFTRVVALGYSDAGAKLIGGQSYSHRFERCAFEGNYGGGTGLYGVYGTSSPGGYTGSFTWLGGGMSNFGWDFYIGGITDYPIDIYDIDSESAGGLLYTNGSSVYFYGGRWLGTTTGNTLVVDARGQNVTFNGMSIEQNGGYNTSGLLTFRFQPYQVGGAPPGLMTFRDTTISTSNFTPSMLFPSLGATAAVFDNARWSDPRGDSTGFFQPTAYTTGTISNTLGSNTVTGTGTAWTSAMASGAIGFGGYTYGIVSVNSPTSLTINVGSYGAGSGSYTLGYGGSSLMIPSLNTGQLSTGPVTLSSLTALGIQGIFSGAGANADFNGRSVVGSSYTFTGPLANGVEPPICMATYYNSAPLTGSAPVSYYITGSTGSWVLNFAGLTGAAVHYLCTGQI